MSGTALSIFSGVASVASVLFGGGGIVILGDFVFNAWEIPERVTWGGGQRMTVHSFPGGKRDVDTMGEDDAPITWSGIFLGPDASFRADELNNMRAAGQPIPLEFAGRAYTVVIDHFTAEQLKLFHLRYQISCCVVQAGETPSQEQPTAESQSQDDTTQASQGFTAAPTPAQNYSKPLPVPPQPPLNTFIDIPTAGR